MQAPRHLPAVTSGLDHLLVLRHCTVTEVVAEREGGLDEHLPELFVLKDLGADRQTDLIPERFHVHRDDLQLTTGGLGGMPCQTTHVIVVRVRPGTKPVPVTLNTLERPVLGMYKRCTGQIGQHTTQLGVTRGDRVDVVNTVSGQRSRQGIPPALNDGSGSG